MTRLGYQRLMEKTSNRFKLRWVEKISDINYGTFREGEQLVNHIPNNRLLTTKIGLLESLRDFARSDEGRAAGVDLASIVPESYRMDDKADVSRFLEVLSGTLSPAADGPTPRHD